jgi:hypothetical protein
MWAKFAQFDKDGDGKIDPGELSGAVDMYTREVNVNQTMKKIFFLTLGVFVFALACIYGLNVKVANDHKDTVFSIFNHTEFMTTKSDPNQPVFFLSPLPSSPFLFRPVCILCWITC